MGTLQLKRRLTSESQGKNKAKVMLISKNEPNPVGTWCDNTESKLLHLVFVVRSRAISFYTASSQKKPSPSLPSVNSFPLVDAACGWSLINP